MDKINDIREGAGQAVPPRAEQRRGATALYDVADVIVSAMIIIMVIFIFFFRFAGVSGGSMLPTLHDGDWLVVSSEAYDDPQYRDIVIVTQPNYFHEPIVKRVIATGGQTVDIDPVAGIVYVDGEALDEPYTMEPTYTLDDIQFPLTVPEGMLFVMGDNRNDSSDSRSSKVGLIDQRYVLGKVSGRLMPLGQWKVE